jgi:hypothetical protein
MDATTTAAGAARKLRITPPAPLTDPVVRRCIPVVGAPVEPDLVEVVERRCLGFADRVGFAGRQGVGVCMVSGARRGGAHKNTGVQICVWNGRDALKLNGGG